LPENFTAYTHSLPAHPSREYTGTSAIITGKTTDDRFFARLEVQKISESRSALESWVLATGISHTQTRALFGLHFATGKLFIQEPIRRLPSVQAEFDGGEEVGGVGSEETLGSEAMEGIGKGGGSGK
jgi:hypothetical protein